MCSRGGKRFGLCPSHTWACCWVAVVFVSLPIDYDAPVPWDGSGERTSSLARRPPGTFAMRLWQRPDRNQCKGCRSKWCETRWSRVETSGKPRRAANARSRSLSGDQPGRSHGAWLLVEDHYCASCADLAEDVVASLDHHPLDVAKSSPSCPMTSNYWPTLACGWPLLANNWPAFAKYGPARSSRSCICSTIVRPRLDRSGAGRTRRDMNSLGERNRARATRRPRHMSGIVPRPTH